MELNQYITHPDAVVICLDATDSSYRKKINMLLQLCDRQMAETERYIALTKIDLANKEELCNLQFILESLKNDKIIKGYFQTSSKAENSNINQAFEEIISNIDPTFIITQNNNTNPQSGVERLIQQIKSTDNASKIVSEIKPSFIDSLSISDMNKLMGTLQESKYPTPSFLSSLFQTSPYKNVSDLIFKRFDKLVQTDPTYSLAMIPGYSRLHHAANYGATFLVQEILKFKKADVDLKAEFNRTPLHLAVFNGQLAAMKLLLDNGANPSIETEQQQNALFIALERACIYLPGAAHKEQDKRSFLLFSEIIKTLIDSNRVDVNAKTSAGLTISSMLVKYYNSLEESERQLFRENIASHFEPLLSSEQKQALSLSSKKLNI